MPERPAPTAEHPTGGLPPVAPGRVEGVHPLSHQQEGLARMMTRAGGRHDYWLRWAVRLTGQVVPERLAEAAAIVIARHPALWTRIAPVAEGLAQDTRHSGATAIHRLTATSSAPDTVLRRFFEAATRAEPLGGDPTCSLAVIDDSTGTVVGLAVHHLVFDLWSWGLFLNDLGVAYRHLSTGGPFPDPPAVTYADYAHWQRRHLTGVTYDHHLDHWRRLAAGYPAEGLPVLRRTADRPPAGPADKIEFHVDRHVIDALTDVARHHRTTTFVVLLAMFQATLAAELANTDVLVGVVTANRRRPEIADVVGFFANGRILRSTVTPDTTAADLINHVAAQWAQGHHHQELHLEKTVLDLGLPDLVNVKFGLRNALSYLPPPDFGPDITTTPIPEAAAQTARRDLSVSLNPTASGATVTATYRTDAFSRADATTLASAYLTALHHAAESPTTRLGDIHPPARPSGT